MRKKRQKPVLYWVIRTIPGIVPSEIVPNRDPLYYTLIVECSLRNYTNPNWLLDYLFSFLFLLFSFQDGNIPLFAAVEAGNLHVCRELLLQETEAQLKYTKVCEKNEL